MNTIRWILLNSTVHHLAQRTMMMMINFIQTTYNVCYIILTFFFFSLDNVTLHLDGVLYLRVTDPFKVCFFCLRQTCYIYRPSTLTLFHIVSIKRVRSLRKNT